MKLGQALVGIALLLLAAAAADAADYKSWVPFLPQELAGLKKSGDPDGMNMEMSGQAWSTLHQDYASDGSEKRVSLTLVGGKDAPPMASYQAMSSMKMETDEMIVKTVKVAGYAGLLNYEKLEKRGTLMISLRQDLMVVLEADTLQDETEIVSIAETIPLADLAAQTP